MANPSGVPKMSSDGNVQDVYFKFTVGAAGAVTLLDKSFDISNIALGAAGTYTITLRERWSELVDYDIDGISTTYNRCQVTQDNSGLAAQTVVFTTATETAGTLTTANLAANTPIRGRLGLRNGVRL